MKRKQISAGQFGRLFRNVDMPIDQHVPVRRTVFNYADNRRPDSGILKSENKTDRHQNAGIRHMIFFGNRDIFDSRNPNNIMGDQHGGFIIWYAKQVQGVPCLSHRYIIIGRIPKSYAARQLTEIFRFLYSERTKRNFNLRYVENVI